MWVVTIVPDVKQQGLPRSCASKKTSTLYSLVSVSVMALCYMGSAMLPTLVVRVFRQYVFKLVFGVDVFDLDFGVQINSIEQTIKRNSVDPGNMSHCGTSSFDIILITASLSSKIFNFIPS